MSLEKRIATLEAIEAIKTLKARYALYADRKYTNDHARQTEEEVDRVSHLQAACFTEDAEWDAGVFGIEKGREALFHNFRSKPWRFAVHVFSNPIISVNGDTANGMWTLWMLATVKATGVCLHSLSYTHDEYRCVDGEWLIS